jgi:hypothetical protein
MSGGAIFALSGQISNNMKKLLLVAGLGIFSVQEIQAQQGTDVSDADVSDAKIPQTVKKALRNQYPNTSHVNWRIKEASYKARFTVSDAKHMAVFNNAGTLIKKGVAIPKEDLPSVVNNAISREYPDTKPDDIYRMKNDEQTIFLIEINRLRDQWVVYDEEGNVIELKN